MAPWAACPFSARWNRLVTEPVAADRWPLAQRLTDFVWPPIGGFARLQLSGRPNSVDLTRILPPFVVDRLVAGIRAFDRKMKGYIHPDAIVVAPESRTSSPVRMERDPATLMFRVLPAFIPVGKALDTPAAFFLLRWTACGWPRPSGRARWFRRPPEPAGQSCWRRINASATGTMRSPASPTMKASGNPASRMAGSAAWASSTVSY